MTRQTEVEKIAEMLKTQDVQYPNATAAYLVDHGIRSKDGFEIVKSMDNDWNKRTGGILKLPVIQPIDYKENNDKSG